MAESDTKLNYKLASIIRALMKTYPLMTTQQAFLFFVAANNQGKSLSELAALTNYPLPSMSRKISDLGPITRTREPGMGLIELKVDPEMFSRKQIFLTSKGKALLNDIYSIWRG